MTEQKTKQKTVQKTVRKKTPKEDKVTTGVVYTMKSVVQKAGSLVWQHKGPLVGIVIGLVLGGSGLRSIAKQLR